MTHKHFNSKLLPAKMINLFGVQDQIHEQ